MIVLTNSVIFLMLSPCRYKHCSSVLAPVITRIVNLSLATGEFSPQLKKSIITPLLKKPILDKENLANYRPISNLSTISKVTERVVKSVLMHAASGLGEMGLGEAPSQCIRHSLIIFAQNSLIPII